MSDLFATWFGPLDEGLGSGTRFVAPDRDEVEVLLEIGKLAAEAAPDRYYALLTGFAVGRALGRSEVGDPSVNSLDFLKEARRIVSEISKAS